MLLRITGTGERFNQVTQQQTLEVVRTYRSIVTTSTGLELPATITEEIANCFITVYDWRNFAPGIARILATSLEAGELELLLDFFRDRSVPPTHFQDFRRGLDKADLIESRVADYIFTTGQDCQSRAAELIKQYIALVQPPSSD